MPHLYSLLSSLYLSPVENISLPWEERMGTLWEGGCLLQPSLLHGQAALCLSAALPLCLCRLSACLFSWRRVAGWGGQGRACGWLPAFRAGRTTGVALPYLPCLPPFRDAVISVGDLRSPGGGRLGCTSPTNGGVRGRCTARLRRCLLLPALWRAFNMLKPAISGMFQRLYRRKSGKARTDRLSRAAGLTGAEGMLYLHYGGLNSKMPYPLSDHLFNTR